MRVDETDETITVSGTSGSLTVNSATITLTDDDAPTATLKLMPDSISENGGVATVTATLNRASSAAVTLTVVAAAGTDTAADDFTLSSTATLTIAAGSTVSAGTVTVTANDDATPAPDKSVTVSATVSGGHGVAAPSALTLIITDDDSAADPVAVTLSMADASAKEGEEVVFVLELSPPAPAAMTVTCITAPVTATPGGDYEHTTNHRIPIAAGRPFGEGGDTDDRRRGGRVRRDVHGEHRAGAGGGRRCRG